jgi:hypothetical protein
MALAEDIADGLHQWETPLGITSVSEAKVRADIVACIAAETEADVAKNNRQTAADALQAADDAASAFILAAKGVLVSFLGPRWSSAWAPTGFPDDSTAVPQTQEKRFKLCARLNEYFTANPTREFPANHVTAAKALEHHEAVSDGRTALGQKTVLQGQKLKARDAAYHVLAGHLRTLIMDLANFLADDDDRWHAFGLNAPADPDTPEPVSDLTLEAGLPGEIVASWPRAPRATRYRPFVQRVGVDEAFVARDAVHDLTVTLDAFTTGQTVKVYIIAANDDGQAPAGPTKEILIP